MDKGKKTNREGTQKKRKGNWKRATDMESRSWGGNDVALIHNHIKTPQIKRQVKYKEEGFWQVWKFYLF